MLCEGGPTLLAHLTADGLLNELCLTISPVLAGPGAARITAGAAFPARRLALVHVLRAEGALFCRYSDGELSLAQPRALGARAELLSRDLSVIT